MIEYEELTGSIIGAAMEVHKVLGPGLLESVYESCLCRELELRKIPFRRQTVVPVQYKGLTIERGLIADVLVDEKVILELKAVEKVDPIHEAQLLTYLKLTGIRVGLLINFNVPVLKDGIRRRIV